MTLDLDELERVAKAATPGPWRVEGFVKRGGAIAKIISHGMNERGDGPAGYVGDTYGEADAKFVAALNPAVCLALISRARGAERLEEMLALTQELCLALISRARGAERLEDEKNPIIAGLEDAVAGRIGRVTVKPSDELVKAMVGRFLAWRLPKNFHPDGGIIFMPGPHARGDFGEAYINANWPDGANLLDYEQATEMVRHIIAPAEGNWAAYEASIEEGERG